MVTKPSERLKVGAAQISSVFLDKKANLGKVDRLLEEAAKSEAKLTVFPECALTGYAFSNLEEVRKVAEPVPGPSTDQIEASCTRLGCWVVIGLVEAMEGSFYNTAVLIGPDGVAAKHQKAHLPYQGLDRFSKRGEGPLKVHETPIGKLGLAVCYDMFFPETSRVLALMGSELLAVPTNWAEGVEFYVDYLCQARAVENHINLIAANRCGEERGFKFYGKSRIVDCGGKILAEAGRDEELITAELDMIEPHRKHIVRILGQWETDYVKDRRPELYEMICTKLKM